MFSLNTIRTVNYDSTSNYQLYQKYYSHAKSYFFFMTITRKDLILIPMYLITYFWLVFLPEIDKQIPQTEYFVCFKFKNIHMIRDSESVLRYCINLI